MEKQIILKNASFTYEKQNKKSINNISMTIKQGEFVVFTGASGCGKTTLTRVINNLIPDFYEGELTGKISVCGIDIHISEAGETGKFVASVFQDPRSQFFTTNSSSEVAFALENYGIERNEMIQRVDEAFEQLNIVDLKNKNIFDLSSGERQKVAIATAYALRPQVLVLDEPSANLDIFSIFEIGELLKMLKNAGHTIIISEHRLFWLKALADRYVFIHEGKVLNDLPSNQIDTLATKSNGLRTFDIETVHYAANPISTNTEKPLLVAKDMSFGFNKKETLLEKVSFSSNAGEIVAVVGENGCGKTTFGKLLSGLLPFQKGEITINGIKIKPRDLSKYTYFVMQEADHQLHTDSVLKELCEGGENATVDKATNILKEIGLLEYKDTHPYALSGGQKQRVAISAAAMTQKPIVIFDEPTSGLDYNSMLATAQIIGNLAKEGKLVLIISHDAEFLSNVATCALHIDNKIVESSFKVENNDDFQTLKNCMLCKSNQKAQRNIKRKIGIYIDPRVYLFQIALSGTLAFILYGELAGTLLFAAMLATALLSGKIKTAFYFCIAFTAFSVFIFLVPLAGSFFSFFTRFMPLTLGVCILMQTTEVTQLITSLENMRLPPQIILPLSVMLRFFPSLIQDASYIRQAMKTRGIGIARMVAHPMQTYEFFVIPMLMRVLLTANELAASAETRGLSINCTKTQFLIVKMRVFDYILLVTMLFMYCFIIKFATI